MSIGPSYRDPPRTIDDEARDWLALIHAGEPSAEDRARFEAWLNASPAHRAAFEGAEATWTLLGSSDQIESLMDEVGAAEAARAKSRPDARGLRWPVGVAAAAAVAVIAVPVSLHVLNAPPEPTRYVAGTAETDTFELADGTQVTLGARSTIDVRYAKGAREIDLVRGEAFFDVAHDASRPLTVDVSGTEIRVLGTAFGVRYGPKDVSVTVSEGLVSVGLDEADGAGTHRSLTQIVAGTRLTADLDGAIQSEAEVDIATALSWMEGVLTYDGDTLADVIADINRYRAKRVVIQSDALNDLRITASFKTDQTDQFLAGLPVAYPIEVKEFATQTQLRARR